MFSDTALQTHVLSRAQSERDRRAAHLGLGAHEGDGFEERGDEAHVLDRPRDHGHERVQPHGNALLAPQHHHRPPLPSTPETPPHATSAQQHLLKAPNCSRGNSSLGMMLCNNCKGDGLLLPRSCSMLFKIDVDRRISLKRCVLPPVQQQTSSARHLTNLKRDKGLKQPNGAKRSNLCLRSLLGLTGHAYIEPLSLPGQDAPIR